MDRSDYDARGNVTAAGAEQFDWTFDVDQYEVLQAELDVTHRMESRSYYAADGLLRVHQVNRDEFFGTDSTPGDPWGVSGGFSVDASVRIEGEDRAGIERLVRYCARPPFALERLHALEGASALASPDSRLLYRFPKPDVHGRTEILLTPLELLERIARFVPPPRVHRHRYHGVLAPNATSRAQVVAIGRPERRAEAPEPSCEAASPGLPPEPGPAPASPARIRWAVLLARIYEVLPLLCPACGGEMRILAFLTDPPVLRAILLHLHLPHKPPPLSPARAPPQTEILGDPSTAFDLAEPEPIPEFEFDQSVPDDYEFDA